MDDLLRKNRRGIGSVVLGWTSLHLLTFASGLIATPATGAILALVPLAMVIGATRRARPIIAPALALAVGLMAGELARSILGFVGTPAAVWAPVFAVTVAATTLIVSRTATPALVRADQPSS